MEEIAQIQLPPFTTELIISPSGLLNTSVPSADDVELNKSTYILVCPNCAQANSLISQLHADVVELPGNRRYFVFDTLTFCLVIWNDFMEVEHLDDEYLFEFRRFCTKTKFINNLWFYLPKKIASEQQQQYAQIFNQFKAMFKKDIVCFFCFFATIESNMYRNRHRSNIPIEIGLHASIHAQKCWHRIVA